MRPPRIDPVGVLEHPAGYATRPRTYPRLLRIVALVTLLGFAGVATATTVMSLARYCLTSQAGAPPPG